MGRTIIITHPAYLNDINDVIHDCWFEADQVKLHADAVLRIPFVRYAHERESFAEGSVLLKRVSTPAVKCVLQIGDVQDYTLAESEGVGQYDFNVIEYDPIAKTITIRTGIPLRFHANVRSINIMVEETDEIVEERTGIRIF